MTASAATNGKDAACAGVVLAAGSSRRFGAANKLLAEIDGEPMLRRVVGRMAQSRVGTIIVVTGHDSEAVAGAVDGLDVIVVHNPRHLEGMGTSVAAGIAALPDTVHWAAVTPGDLPDLSPALVDRLLATARAEGNRIVIPVLASGDQRNPVVWPRRFFAELARLEGDVGGRKLVEAHSAQVVRLTVDEPSQFTDIDRPEDLTARHERPDKAPR